jgi:hypothetical protein
LSRREEVVQRQNSREKDSFESRAERSSLLCCLSDSLHFSPASSFLLDSNEIFSLEFYVPLHASLSSDFYYNSLFHWKSKEKESSSREEMKKKIYWKREKEEARSIQQRCSRT